MMQKENSIVLFGQKQVRRHWDDRQEQWYFSVMDVIEILTDNKRPRKYWNDLKKKLSAEGSEVSEKIGQLKMPAPDGKMRLTDDDAGRSIHDGNFEKEKTGILCGK